MNEIRARVRPRESSAAPMAFAPVSALAVRIAGARGGLRLVLAVLAGVAMTLGHVPVSIPLIWFVAIPVLVWLIDGAEHPVEAAWIGWGAGFGYFVTGLHWIGHAFLVDAEKFAWLLPFAVTLLPAGLGLFWAAAFWLAQRYWPWHWSRVLSLAAALTVVEYARTHLFTGFPWALPAYIWSETGVVQVTAWIGSHGLTLLTVALTGLPLVVLAGWRGRSSLAIAAGPLAALAVLWAAGAARVEDPSYADDAGVLRIVQPNAAQDLKWDPDHAQDFFDRLIRETTAAADPTIGSPSAVIWPETAVTFLPVDRPDLTQAIAERAGGAPVLLGALHREGSEPPQWYNALMVIQPDGSLGDRYDKHHLVPFGEYLPFEGLFTALGLRQLANRGGFTPGPGPRVMDIDGLPPFAALICYEMIFPHEVVPGAERPAWMLQITNDAWFGGFAGPQQHLAQARIRAIEQGLPVARAANTGISAMIDPYGQIRHALALGEHGKIDAKLPQPLDATLYSRFGDWPAILLTLILLLALHLPHHFRSTD
ncbi:MAG: apolipoprotein N-acyltransferase [Pseudomonadota bacterium]